MSMFAGVSHSNPQEAEAFGSSRCGTRDTLCDFPVAGTGALRGGWVASKAQKTVFPGSWMNVWRCW